MFNKKNIKIPLDKFIDKALYHPKNGYYMRKVPFGQYGDFVTAPNISKIFSEMVFLWLISYWEKFYKGRKINIVELGAGNGEMISQIISSAKNYKIFYNKCDFIIFEKSNKLIKLQKEKLKNQNIKWLKNLDKLQNKPTIFVGNEFLDALPIKQFINFKGNWYERYVQKHKGIFYFTKVKCNMKRVENKIKLKLSKNQNFLEISFEEIKIIKKLNNIIKKNNGCILFIDYAHSNQKMFDTLQAVKKHKKADILNDIGNADISHMVNLSFLRKITKNLNLKIKFTTQRKFLLNLGIMKRAEILANRASFLEKANIFYRINRLIDRRQMGELFKVILLHKKNKQFNLGFK